MTIKDLIDATDDYGPYLAHVEILINGKPVDDVSYGIIAETGQLTVNLQSYEQEEADPE